MYYKEIDEDGIPVTDGYYAIASSKGYLDMYRLNRIELQTVYSFQYSFDTATQIFSVANYCSKYFKKEWIIGIHTSFFESKEDLMLLKLRVQ